MEKIQIYLLATMFILKSNMIMDISKDVWTKIRQKTERMDFSG